jgi:hypothetical protein
MGNIGICFLKKENMKWFLILLLIPCSCIGQTVHMEDERIVYKGLLKTNVAFEQLKPVIEKAMQSTRNKNLLWTDDSLANEITIKAEMKLKSDPSVVNYLQYKISFNHKDDGYEYKIDSVSLQQKERGYDTKLISSKELIKELDNTGTVATLIEKQLNEMDMRFQQLLDVLRNYLKEE